MQIIHGSGRLDWAEVEQARGRLSGLSGEHADLVQRYPDLDIKQDWPRLLSLGEQQRLAFARLLLNSPRFVVLDEATSALDVTTERLLYELLVQREMAFVSVGHRPTLTAYHDTVLELDGSGAWRLLPAAGYDFGREA